MPSTRHILIAAVVIAAAVAAFLIWHWSAERQVRLAFENLVERIEKRNWGGVARLVSEDYSDEWGLTRETGLRLASDGLRHFMVLEIEPIAPDFEISGDEATVRTAFHVSGHGTGLADVIVGRAAEIDEPFELVWRRESGAPWSWRLVSVRQPQLQLQGYMQYLDYLP